MTSPSPHRAELAKQLRQVRIDAGHSGSSWARVLGWTQPRVSRVETGKQMPSSEDLTAWVMHAGLDDERAAQMERLLELASVEYANWRVQFRQSGGAESTQRAIGHRDKQTAVLRQLAIGLLPGLVQTAAYARAAVSIPWGPTAWGTPEEDLERLVAARMERQAVLYEPGREFRFVIAEGALRTRYTDDESVFQGQLDRLATLAGMDALDVRIMPDATPWPVFPLASFRVHDLDSAVLEQQVGEHTVTDPDQVKAYAEMVDACAEVSVAGDEAVELIRTVAAESAR